MSSRVTSIDVLKAMDKAVDTMKTYHEVTDPSDSAIHWIRINGFMKGVLLDLFWDADSEKRQELIDRFNKETEEYMHKLTLESLRAKETA